MRVLIDLGALFAVLLLGYLFYLVLFERGTLYRTSGDIHGLGDKQRLQLLSALLGTPPQQIHSCRALREGPELYDAQLAAIAAAKTSIHLEVYIYYPGRMADAFLAALCERAKAACMRERGVRTLFDHRASGESADARHHTRLLPRAGCWSRQSQGSFANAPALGDLRRELNLFVSLTAGLILQDRIEERRTMARKVLQLAKQLGARCFYAEFLGKVAITNGFPRAL